LFNIFAGNLDWGSELKEMSPNSRPTKLIWGCEVVKKQEARGLEDLHTFYRNQAVGSENELLSCLRENRHKR